MSYGVLAEFRDAPDLLRAARALRNAGYSRLEAYSPFPVDGLAEALGDRGNPIGLITLIGGLIGGLGGWWMQYYAAAIDYPINVGGRPLNSWPAFVPVIFELTVLCAAFAAFFGLLVLNRLPQLTHPLFAVREFDLATRNRFFLCVRESDPRFERAAVERLFGELGALAVTEVPA